MSAAAPRFDTPEADARLDWLAQNLLRNRFLPVPPSECCFVGDGDFLGVGVEFLQWFVRAGGLKPGERVLDLGCGIGRMALPLTQYLDAGTYDGVDIAAGGIEWCRIHIGVRYGNFRFHRLDLRHPLYNPEGTMDTREVRLPFADGAFDFAFMTSVLTHLQAEEIRAYARELRRVMAPGARLFVTAFMLNRPAREGLLAGRGLLPFDGAGALPQLHAYADNPAAAVAYDEDYLLSLFLEAGLRRARPPVYGRWSGRPTPGPSFQDINILEIEAERR
ncbi:MAG TPA: methyltransferase domain-containing protein [Candidatus Sulfotelmatobacter sp.]|nr:methyltransferase domain-containing protein [Candidatus Sulfotelmatobacter sp.]